MRAINSSYTSNERAKISSEGQHVRVRSHSPISLARDFLIGILTGLIALGLHQMFRAMLFARKLNY